MNHIYEKFKLFIKFTNTTDSYVKNQNKMVFVFTWNILKEFILIKDYFQQEHRPSELLDPYSIIQSSHTFFPVFLHGNVSLVFMKEHTIYGVSNEDQQFFDRFEAPLGFLKLLKEYISHVSHGGSSMGFSKMSIGIMNTKSNEEALKMIWALAERLGIIAPQSGGYRSAESLMLMIKSKLLDIETIKVQDLQVLAKWYWNHPVPYQVITFLSKVATESKDQGKRLSRTAAAALEFIKGGLADDEQGKMSAIVSALSREEINEALDIPPSISLFPKVNNNTILDEAMRGDILKEFSNNDHYGIFKVIEKGFYTGSFGSQREDYIKPLEGLISRIHKLYPKFPPEEIANLIKIALEGAVEVGEGKSSNLLKFDFSGMEGIKKRHEILYLIKSYIVGGLKISAIDIGGDIKEKLIKLRDSKEIQSRIEQVKKDEAMFGRGQPDFLNFKGILEGTDLFKNIEKEFRLPDSEPVIIEGVGKSAELKEMIVNRTKGLKDTDLVVLCVKVNSNTNRIRHFLLVGHASKFKKVTEVQGILSGMYNQSPDDFIFWIVFVENPKLKTIYFQGIYTKIYGHMKEVFQRMEKGLRRLFPGYTLTAQALQDTVKVFMNKFQRESRLSERQKERVGDIIRVYEYGDQGIGADVITFKQIPDAAMRGKKNDAAMAPGGIDMNSANLNMQVIKRDGNGVPLPISQQDMAQLSRISGFVPRILEIRPVSSLFYPVEKK